jgi:hypothetical protein
VPQKSLGYSLKRPVGHPPIDVRRYYANLSYQAQRRRCGASWPRSSGTQASFIPRVGFIVTNLSSLAECIVGFYNRRGTAEQWIKQGRTR